MKKIIFILLLSPLFLKAQEHLMVQGTSNNLYVTHKAAPKENFYSIGRIYNISPKEVAPYNNLVLEKGLSLGQEIKIPLKENFTQGADIAADETAVPVYHKTTVKETLYQLSNQYNKVSPASLKAWNNLKSDALTPGQDIIIGYLKVKKELSPLASKGIAIPTSNMSDEKKPVIAEVKTPVKNTDPAKSEAKVTPTPAAPQPKENIPVKTMPAPETKPVATVPVQNTGSAKESAFKSLYSNSGKMQNGRAGIFKSTSGWEDGKYYCLHNTAPQNSIVKITNTATGKFIYAKVLDIMPDLKQNNDIEIRVSNAAADALGAGNSDFDCTISY